MGCTEGSPYSSRRRSCFPDLPTKTSSRPEPRSHSSVIGVVQPNSCTQPAPSARVPIQCYHLLQELTHELELVTLGSAWSFVAVFLFCVGCPVCVFGFCPLFSFLCGAVTTYWTVHRSFTSSLLRPLNQQMAMFALINHAT